MRFVPQDMINPEHYIKHARIVCINDEYVTIMNYQELEGEILPAEESCMEMFFVWLSSNAALKVVDAIKEIAHKNHRLIMVRKIKYAHKELLVVAQYACEEWENAIEIREIVVDELRGLYINPHMMIYNAQRFAQKEPKIFYETLDEYFAFIKTY